MELTGEQILPLPRERVWAALNDPEILKASVPGCESFERVEDNQFQMVMAATVGPIKARFKGRMVLTDLQPPRSYSLSFEGSGGAAGFGKGGAHVDLVSESSGATRLVYRSHAQVGGRLAQVGGRLIDGVARKMAEEFFGRFTAALVGPKDEGAGDAASGSAAPPASASNGVAPERGMPRGGAGAGTTAAAIGHPPASAGASLSGKAWAWAFGAAVVVGLIAVYALHR
jgi:uncharacterized protein